MSWKNRAEEVSSSKSSSNWKDRAELHSEPEEESLLTNAKDLAMGAGQGITLGGGDELLAGLEATKDAALDDKYTNWLDAYRKHQQENEDTYNNAKQRSPVLTTVGEIGGGLALPVGAVGLAGKGMTTLGKAALGAGTGAVAGALGSEGNLQDSPEEVAKDAAFGGAFGGAADPLIKVAGVAGKGIKKVVSPITDEIKDFIAKRPLLRQTAKSFEEGMAGRTFGGEENRVRLMNEKEKAASELSGALEKGQKHASEEYGKVLEGVDFKFSPEQSSKFDDVNNILETMKTRTGATNDVNLATLQKMRTGETVSAQEIKDLQKYLRDNAGKINQGETVDQVLSASKEASNILEQGVPGYGKVNKMYQKVEEPIESFVSNVPTNELDFATRNRIQTEGAKPFATARTAIEKSQLPFNAGQQQFEQLEQLKKGLTSLKETHPEVLEKMGITNIDDYFNNIKSQSDVQAINNIINKTGALNKDLGLLEYGTAKGAYTLANLSGATAQKAGNVVTKMSNKLYSASSQSLAPLAKQLEANPSTAYLGKALSNSINETMGNKSSASKNAILFSIMQNPEARKTLAPFLDGEQQQSGGPSE